MPACAGTRSSKHKSSKRWEACGLLQELSEGWFGCSVVSEWQVKVGEWSRKIIQGS